MAESVQPSLMDRFYQETFQLIQRYSRESAQLRVPKDPQPLQPQHQEFQPISQFIQPATQNMTQGQNRRTEMVNDYIQPRDQTTHQTMDYTSNQNQRCQSADPNIWNTLTPTAGLLEARPVSAPDLMATGLQMSGLSSLMDTSHDYRYQPSSTDLQTPRPLDSNK